MGVAQFEKTFVTTEDTEITENKFLKFQCIQCFQWLPAFPLYSLCLCGESGSQERWIGMSRASTNSTGNFFQ